jgi:hypothetical protein
MTTEQKAKAYDEALERAKELIAKWSGKNKDFYIEDYSYIFPELAESEDERIRKSLIDALKTSKTVGELKFVFPEPTREECIAYLEKQKEQKPELYYDKELDNAAREFYLSGGADSPVDSTGLVPIVRMAEFGATWMKERMEKEQKPAWSEEDVDMLNSCISSIEEAKENRYAYKETDGDTSYDHEIAWLKSLRPSWKPTEDEERLINTSISFLKDFADKGYENAVECIDWLKSKLNGNTCE